ncbi:MAG: glycosyltransferase [Acidobacteriota bacterium]
MRLAYFTPLPPSKSGVADYNAELLPHLARGAEISVFVEQMRELRAHQNRPDFAVYHAVHFDEIHRQNPFDLCLYHQGNNQYHEYIYERALQTPGLVVMHEHCLHHFIAWRTLGRDNEDEYWDEMFYAYGTLGARIAEMRAGGVGSDYQQFLLPLSRRLISASRGVITHNGFSAAEIAREVPDIGRTIPLAVFPHHLAPQTYELDGWDKLDCRRRLGLAEDAWVIGSLGFVTQAKRIPATLRAFKRLLKVLPNAVFVIVGEDHTRHPVTPLIEELGLRNQVRVTGYATEQDFFRYLKAVDVVVNLRYPTAGESSGTLTRALGAGKPVIVSDFGQFAELPDDVCLKVTTGPNEEHELYAKLRALAYRPTLREQLSQRARDWVRSDCDVRQSAARYLQFAEEIIRRAAVSSRQAAAVGHSLAFKEAPTIKLDEGEALRYVAGFFADDPNATSYLQKHGRRIIETVELVPVGQPQQRLLELSSYLQMTPLIKRYGQYGEIVTTNWWQGEPREKTIAVRQQETGEELRVPMRNLDVERERFPFPDGHFDVALCCELIEHLTMDPLHMLTELNRVLRWGGLLILTTPNITSAFSIGKALAGNSPYVYGEYNLSSPGDRHSREYAPSEIRRALNAAGFKVLRLFTKDLWCETDAPFLQWLAQTAGPDVPPELRGDNIFAVGRKQSTQFDRFPDGLYD